MPTSQKTKPVLSTDKLNRAYRTVFGMDGQRTEAQKMVLADIEREGKIWRNAWIPNDKMEVDPYRAAIAEGQRIHAIRIIQMANSVPRSTEDTAKPKSITSDKDITDD